MLGIAEECGSPYASPVVLYKKNNLKQTDVPEELSFSMNYRRLNVQKFFINPMPRIE